MPKLHGIAAMRKAKDLLGGQNSRFWMSATSRTVIVRGVPNGGSVRLTGANNASQGVWRTVGSG